jgi:hypothetical protein
MKPFIRTTLASTVTALLLAAAGTVQADPVSFLPAGTDVQFKYNNLEFSPNGSNGVISQVGDILNGIGLITSIGKSPVGSPIYWASGLTDGTELTLIFDGLTAAQVGTSGGQQAIWFTGGTLTFYNVPSGTYAPTGPGGSAAQVCPGGVCPTPWLELAFAPGHVPADDPLTPLFDESTTTLFSTLNSLTDPFQGSGFGRLEIIGGTAASKFEDRPGTWDMDLQSNFNSCVPGSTAANCQGHTYPAASFDPINAKTIPEPGSIALLGTGLAGFGFIGWRRRNKPA